MGTGGAGGEQTATDGTSPRAPQTVFKPVRVAVSSLGAATVLGPLHALAFRGGLGETIVDVVRLVGLSQLVLVASACCSGRPAGDVRRHWRQAGAEQPWQVMAWLVGLGSLLVVSYLFRFLLASSWPGVVFAATTWLVIVVCSTWAVPAFLGQPGRLPAEEQRPVVAER